MGGTPGSNKTRAYLIKGIKEMTQYVVVVDSTLYNGKLVKSTTDLSTLGGSVSFDGVIFDNSSLPVLNNAGNLVTIS